MPDLGRPGDSVSRAPHRREGGPCKDFPVIVTRCSAKKNRKSLFVPMIFGAPGGFTIETGWRRYEQEEDDE